MPGLLSGKLNVEYVAMDCTLHAVPLADAADERAARPRSVVLTRGLRSGLATLGRA